MRAKLILTSLQSELGNNYLTASRQKAQKLNDIFHRFKISVDTEKFIAFPCA